MKRPDQVKQAPDQGFGERVPPGQFVSQKFPVLTYGPTPRIDLKDWKLRCFGLVDKEMEFTWEEFKALKWTRVTADFHCVTQWSSLDNTWEGVLFTDLMDLVKPKTEANFVMAHCYGNYTTNIPLETLTSDNSLLAHMQNGSEIGERPRLAAAAGGALKVCVEERKMGHRNRVHGGGPTGLLGTAWLQQQRRPVEGRALLARTVLAVH